MKKMLFAALLAAVMCGCGDKKGGSSSSADEDNDSIEILLRENEQLRNEQDELLSTLNEIQEGFREINEAQGRLSIDRRSEGDNARERIREDMKYIQETLAQNAELIEKLRNQLRESGRASEQLKRTIENLTAQMNEKNAEINQLRNELQAKNIRIDELDAQVADLNENLTNMQQQNENQGQTISQQDQQLNSAWYCVGTKRALKDHNILKSGRVLQGEFDASYFTAIDIRQVTQINLNSKGVDILTSHPAGSYQLIRDDAGFYTLQISDYQQFWSTSKYLVVQVK
ncbi:MAG: hypothetical protein J5797_09425 [Prevotella sp.]|nr:hypothetical protein [Prevotella sp.]